MNLGTGKFDWLVPSYVIGYSKARLILEISLYNKYANLQKFTFRGASLFVMSYDRVTAAILSKATQFSASNAKNSLGEHAGSSEQSFPEFDINSLILLKRFDRMRPVIDIEHIQPFLKNYLKESKAKARKILTAEKREKRKAQKESKDCSAKPQKTAKKVVNPKRKSGNLKKIKKESVSSKQIVKQLRTKTRAKK